MMQSEHTISFRVTDDEKPSDSVSLMRHRII